MSDGSPLTADAPFEERSNRYERVRRDLDHMLADIDDWVAVMATVACELHHAFAYFDWTGFYRRHDAETLIVGPYQGTHGCLTIDRSNGICGAAVRTGETQWVDDVSTRPDHIACASTTQSELVVPMRSPSDAVAAVLDVDSDRLGAFESVDCRHLEALCEALTPRVPSMSTIST